MVRDKLRIRFRKGGDLRLVSHLDLLRCFERMLRRAALPFRSTGGFHPTPRLVFALALPLGLVGHAEVAELELDAEIPPAEVAERLRRQAPAGLDILTVRRIPPVVTARPCRVVYRAAVPPEERDGLAERCRALLAVPACWVDRTRPRPRRFDLRPFVNHLSLHPDGLHLDLTVSPTGSARADEVLAVLGLRDWLDRGGVVERLTLELVDEFPDPHRGADAPGSPPRLPPGEPRASAPGCPAHTREGNA